MERGHVLLARRRRLRGLPDALRRGDIDQHLICETPLREELQERALEILEAVPDHPAAKLLLGIGYRMIGEGPAPLRVLEALPRGVSRWAAAFFGYGIALRDADEPAAALKALERAVYLHRPSPMPGAPSVTCSRPKATWLGLTRRMHSTSRLPHRPAAYACRAGAGQQPDPRAQARYDCNPGDVENFVQAGVAHQPSSTPGIG